MPMTAPTTSPSKSPIGQPISRVDGRLKVTGRAVYAADTQQSNVCHAVLVGSPIAKGKITSIDTSEAEKSVGVIKVVTPENRPKIGAPKKGDPMSG
ncbi:MAG: putative Xanthine dehydrogenase, partial [Phycisphaerales bacterium]|nr:putative Xanthine dehydrogenase [Phycisphaerales bacterium]